MIISLRDRYVPNIEETIPTWNTLYYAIRLSIIGETSFKYNFNLPRRCGKTYLCGKLIDEFENVIYIASNDNMCRHFCSIYGYINRTYSANYQLDHLRGQKINYILFDEVSSVQTNNVLSYVHPKGYLALRSL